MTYSVERAKNLDAGAGGHRTVPMKSASVLKRSGVGSCVVLTVTQFTTVGDGFPIRRCGWGCGRA